MVTTPAAPATAVLLALCARATGHPIQYARLADVAGQVTSWEGLPAQAEAHGLAPLLYTHLQAAAIPLPAAIQQELQGYYLQHAHAARVRTAVLGEILRALAAAGIDVLVLKGAALAYLVYPQPACRPMRDLDLLVPAADAPRAQALLTGLGFAPAPAAGQEPDHHHLAAIQRTAAGQPISVEVHHRLDLHEPGDPPHPFAEFAPAAQAFTAGEVATRTLGREALLWHVYRHALCLPLTYEPLRLIWLADLVSLVEAGAGTLDWAQLRRIAPALVRLLPRLDALSPWTPPVAARLREEAAALPPDRTPPPSLPIAIELQRRGDLLADAASQEAHLRVEVATARALLDAQDAALGQQRAELETRAVYI
ncbi:MAG TPA: nucleotidyltransferase family protein, partial [Chloroflexia bacterium]|nr:nucleotidyltransferase family protein [Chloroflexia bacterium]